MNYAGERKNTEKKIKRIKRICFFVVIFLIVIVSVFCVYVPVSTWKYYFRLPNISKRGAGELRIHFIDVGQGDCIFLELPDGKTMLIDGGNGDSGNTTAILRYLNALEIETIDYLLLTHADSDHCGGLTKVLENKQINRAFLPKADTTVNKKYAEFYNELLQEEDCTWEYSSRSISLNGTGEWKYTLSFLYPYTYDVEKAEQTESKNNELSAVVWLDYQGVSALFTGDAPLETEELLCRDFQLGIFENRGIDLDDTEIVKVSHHGSMYATSEDLLGILQPETAVISCGEKNDYGHPAKEVLDRLKTCGAQTYRTDTQGNIMITATQKGEYTVSVQGKA